MNWPGVWPERALTAIPECCAFAGICERPPTSWWSRRLECCDFGIQALRNSDSRCAPNHSFGDRFGSLPYPEMVSVTFWVSTYHGRHRINRILRIRTGAPRSSRVIAICGVPIKRLDSSAVTEVEPSVMKSSILLAVAIRGIASVMAAQTNPLASLQAIHGLTNAQASRHMPVEFEATVTYYRDYERTMFVQDGDTAIFVNANIVRS